MIVLDQRIISSVSRLNIILNSLVLYKSETPSSNPIFDTSKPTTCYSLISHITHQLCWCNFLQGMVYYYTGEQYNLKNAEWTSRGDVTLQTVLTVLARSISRYLPLDTTISINNPVNGVFMLLYFVVAKSR